MKIYNKKGLVWGIVWLILGSWLLIIRGLEPESVLPEQIKDVVLALLLIMIGISTVIRGCSKRATREDKLEELDERNQLIELKTKSKSFQLTQRICFCLMLALFAMGKVWAEVLFINVGIGLAVVFSISIYTELLPISIAKNTTKGGRVGANRSCSAYWVWNYGVKTMQSRVPKGAPLETP